MKRQVAKRPGRIRASILQWLGVPVGLLDQDFWNAFARSSGAAGQKVDQDSILSLSAAWACTRLVSESIGTLPLKVYERRPDGSRRLATDHPLYPILHTQPNADCMATSYWEAKAAAVQLRGTALSRKLMVGERLVGLEFMPPTRLHGRRNSNGTVEVWFTQDNGRQVQVPDNRIFRVPGFSLDGKWGLSTIKYGAGVFGSALAAQEAANGTFERGLMPTTSFSIDKILKPEQREEFRKNLKKITGALHAGESPLLEGGMKADQIGIPPSDAQLLESRGFSVEEVCRWWLVDPSMVGHGNKDSNWGTGLEQKLIRYLTFTLRPLLTRIEQAVNVQLFSPSDRLRYYVEFAIEGLLRADSQARAAFYSVMVNNGIMTRDEVRQLENMPTMGGNAGVLTVQSAMTPLDSIGLQSDGDRARSALAAWLKEKDDEAQG